MELDKAKSVLDWAVQHPLSGVHRDDAIAGLAQLDAVEVRIRELEEDVECTNELLLDCNELCLRGDCDKLKELEEENVQLRGRVRRQRTVSPWGM